MITWLARALAPEEEEALARSLKRETSKDACGRRRDVGGHDDAIVLGAHRHAIWGWWSWW